MYIYCMHLCNLHTRIKFHERIKSVKEDFYLFILFIKPKRATSRVKKNLIYLGE